MKGLWVALGVVGVIVLALLFVGGSYVSAKNTLVQKNEDVDAAFSEVNVQQQRRMDLIPNLVAAVKGYVGEESTVLTNIANARAAVMGASDRASNIKAQSQLDVAISPLLRLQENYPNLKSSEQFTRLTDELAGTENRIEVARGRYNRALKDYNIYVQQFPNSIWAGMAGFHYRDEYFKGSSENNVAPKVDFGK
jgi:LemA protein